MYINLDQIMHNKEGCFNPSQIKCKECISKERARALLTLTLDKCRWCKENLRNIHLLNLNLHPNFQAQSHISTPFNFCSCKGYKPQDPEIRVCRYLVETRLGKGQVSIMRRSDNGQVVR